MIVIQPKKKEYELAPEGMINAVCVDVIDVGQAMGVNPDEYGRYLVPNEKYDAKARCKFVFELESEMEDGRRFIQQTDNPASFYKPKPGDSGQTSRMREHLDNWGIELPEDLNKVDLMALLLGKQATLRIKYEPDKKGRIWANITTINPSSATLEPSGEYDPVAARDRIKERALKAAIEGAVNSVKNEE